MAGHTNPPSVSGSGVLPIAATVLGLQNLRRQLFSRPFKGHDFGPMKAAERQSSGATTVSSEAIESDVSNKTPNLPNNFDKQCESRSRIHYNTCFLVTRQSQLKDFGLLTFI